MNPPVTSVEREVVALTIAGQLFGVPVTEVREVFEPLAVTPVPRARPEVVGVTNLRGRIVTLVCARRRLGLPDREPGAPPPMALGVERDGETYGLLVDCVEEVLLLPDSAWEPSPPNLDPAWAQVSAGVYRLEDCLLVAIEAERLLDLPSREAA